LGQVTTIPKVVKKPIVLPDNAVGEVRRKFSSTLLMLKCDGVRHFNDYENILIIVEM
jgi:hypothetical protein